MNQKYIGIVLLILGILIAGVVTFNKYHEDTLIDALIFAQAGSCYLEDGTCLHGDRNYLPLIAGYVLAAALLTLGIYLVFFDRTQQLLAKQHLEVSHALEQARKTDTEKEQFTAFLAGFPEEEQQIIKAIKEQDGILQSTLRYRTGMSKASLSLKLKDLEEKGFITRVPEGRTNKVFLKKKF